MILSDLLKYCEESNPNFHAQLMHHLTDCYNFRDLLNMLKNPDVNATCTMNDFITQRREGNVNFSDWWSYVGMVETLLHFTRAERDGIWDLHAHSFSSMLPYFMRYDHHNYGNGVQYIWQTWCSFNRTILLLKDHRESSTRSKLTMDKNG